MKITFHHPISPDKIRDLVLSRVQLHDRTMKQFAKSQGQSPFHRSTYLYLISPKSVSRFERSLEAFKADYALLPADRLKRRLRRWICIQEEDLQYGEVDGNLLRWMLPAYKAVSEDRVNLAFRIVARIEEESGSPVPMDLDLNSDEWLDVRVQRVSIPVRGQ